jgi:hypothetical protein
MAVVQGFGEFGHWLSPSAGSCRRALVHGVEAQNQSVRQLGVVVAVPTAVGIVGRNMAQLGGSLVSGPNVCRWKQG